MNQVGFNIRDMLDKGFFDIWGPTQSLLMTILTLISHQLQAQRWRNYFNNQMVDISHELRKDYHFVGSTDRIHVFGRRPYIPAIRNWEMLYPDCPKEFLTGG